jgi:hypothetical protein
MTSHNSMNGARVKFHCIWKVAAPLYPRVLSYCPLTSLAAAVLAQAHGSHTIGFLNSSIPTHIPTIYSSRHHIPANKIGKAALTAYPYKGRAVAADA